MTALGLAAAGCLPPQRPSDLADWDSCVVRQSRLESVHQGEEDRLEPTRGDGQVFFASTRWGGGGLIAVEHNWGELLLELPAGARGHDVIRYGSNSRLRAEYRQGHSIINYLSDHLVGEVELVALDGDDAELELELRATEPRIDIAKEGELQLKGKVSAQRVAAQRDCD